MNNTVYDNISTEMAKQVLVILCFVIIGSVCLPGNAETEQQSHCLQKDYGQDSVVCVCNAEHCDTLPKVQKIDNSSVYIKYISTRDGLRFRRSEEEFQVWNSDSSTENVVYIDSTLEYQEILGWGGAFTDATGINVASLSDIVQQRLLESYFGENSIEYSLCRIPIGCTDFSPRGYSYVDTENDVDLKTFALQEEDLLYKIPFIQQALDLTNKELKFFGSPWTAPKWMKTDPKWAGVGTIKQELLPSWAKYLEKFVDEYHKHGVDIWGITTGNEPSLAKWVYQTTPTVSWQPSQMQVFIGDHLGPTLKSSNYSDVKIIALDDQREYLPTLLEIFNDSTVHSYVDGIGVHWYQDWYMPPSMLNDTHNAFPDKFIIYTEACEGSFILDQINRQNVIMGSWKRAESFAYDIIENINHWVTGWIAWNMALNEEGGPTYTSNYVDSSIIVNATADEFYKQPMFYAHGHFSKFVPPGSKRIYISPLEDSSLKVYMSAFKRPDNGIVLVVLNRINDTVPLTVVDGSTQISENLSGQSITTFLYWKD